MTDKIRVVVDLDDDLELTEHGSLERGVYGMDRDGVYHMYHGSKTYLVSFSPKIELSNEKLDTGYTCEYCPAFTCNCEEIIDKNIQAQERTGQQ